MGAVSEFIIENGCVSEVSVYVEPEGVIVQLKKDEKIVVRDQYKVAPVTIVMSEDPDGVQVLCIWPGDGHTVVTKDGVDVLDCP
jgi:hypothetical protein